jgi:hypothetical protein
MRSASAAAEHARCREIVSFHLLGRCGLSEDRPSFGERAAIMKRSRRVVLTMMGTAAIGAVSMGFTPRRRCGPGELEVPGGDGRIYCRATTWYGGFGGTLHHVHGHGHGGGHGHAGG